MIGMRISYHMHVFTCKCKGSLITIFGLRTMDRDQSQTVGPHGDTFVTSDRRLDDLPGICGQGVINFVPFNNTEAKDYKPVKIGQCRSLYVRPSKLSDPIPDHPPRELTPETDVDSYVGSDVIDHRPSPEEVRDTCSSTGSVATLPNVPEDLLSDPPPILSQARYVYVEGHTGVAGPLKSILDSWGLSRHNLIFVFQSESRGWETFVEKLVKSLKRAKECGIKLACILFTPKGFSIQDDVCSEMMKHAPCIKLYCNLGRLGIKKDVDVNYIGLEKISSSNVTVPQFTRWPFYILAKFDSVRFMEIVSEFCNILFPVVYGDLVEQVQSNQFSAILHSLKDHFSRKSLNICYGYHINQRKAAIPVQSLTIESLFLLIADEFAIGDLSKNVLTELAKKKKALVKAGPLLSKPVATTVGGVANIQFCTTYSVMKAKAERGEKPALPTYITKNFGQNDMVVAIYLSDLGSDRAKLRDPLAKMLINILDRLKRNISGKTLNLIFDSNACLLANCKSCGNAKKNADDQANRLCVGVIPLSQITNAQGWDPKDGKIDMFPLCDSNGCVDKYIIVDDCDTWPMRVDQSDMCNMDWDGICDSMVLFNNRSGQNNVVIALTMKATDQLQVVIGDRLNEPEYCYKFDLSNDDTELVEEAILHSLSKDSKISPNHAVRLARCMNKETVCRDTLDGDKSLLAKLVKSVVDHLVTVMKPTEKTSQSESTASITEITEQLSKLMLEFGDSEVDEIMKLQIESDTFRKYLRCMELKHADTSDEEVKKVILSKHSNQYFVEAAKSVLREDEKGKETFDDRLKSLFLLVPGDPIAGLIPVLAHLGRISDLYALLYSPDRRHIVPYSLYAAGVLRHELHHTNGNDLVFPRVSDRECMKDCADDLENLAREVIHNVYNQGQTSVSGYSVFVPKGGATQHISVGQNGRG